MERIAFDLVIIKKGVLFNIFNEKIIGYIGFVGLISMLGFAAVYFKVYEINLLEYAVFKLLIFLFSICVFIQVIKIIKGVDGIYLKKKGLLFFDENEITIDFTEIYPLTEVTYIKFSIADYLGYVVKTNSDGSYKRRAIVCNHLEFQYNQKIYEYQFSIESERQKQLLIEKVIPQMRAKTKVTYLVH
ncbi:hypothetical protein IMCC3317_32250 [Kordia antarctica]|uniref:Uncharacterized protein n=1 Tax=Kordia antarctica TaxID=1218801 RepID=A0A7L4ZMH1_9FLAO|nr:hypothetical protein [Kordia antarctica]QHI37842.1 hypothetical protein IMCC3317_32250 [Kordia antarctica]